MVFKDGGAFDFHSNFERIKERLQQAVEIARESGHITGDGSEIGAGRGGGALAGINMAGVHLEQLPSYEEAGSGAHAPSTTDGQRAMPLRDSGVVLSSDDERSAKASPGGNASTEQCQPPTEPPPGYEEVQQASVADELERRLRRAQ